MKRLLFIAFTILSIHAIAQTNTFPANGNVGIGTNNPSTKLSVLGGISKLTLIGIDGTFDNIIKYGHQSDLESSTTNVNRWHGIDATITAGDAASNKLKFRLYGGGYGNEAPKDIMTLLGNGNVGIGTVNPLYGLSVNGILGAGNNTREDGGYGGIDFTDNGIGYSHSAKIYTFRSSNTGEYYGFTNDYDGTSAQLSIIAKQSTGNISFYTGDPATMKMKITANGNIGIGTTNPQSPLHIKASTGYGSIRISPNSDNAESSMGFFSDTAGTTNSTAWIIGNSAWGNTGKFIIGNQAAGGPIITALQNSNVGIGTTSPAYKLDVLGTIRAKEVLVNLDGGADFVFEKDYKLPTIEHVANYVKENKHLPDIPSANEMVKNGVSMGDMQVKLLQKVEELTLYAIEQNKSKKELEKKYNALLEKVEMLTKQIEKK